jgi:hypothetical protein
VLSAAYGARWRGFDAEGLPVPGIGSIASGGRAPGSWRAEKFNPVNPQILGIIAARPVRLTLRPRGRRGEWGSPERAGRLVALLLGLLGQQKRSAARYSEGVSIIDLT